jgi:hypothetical protein
MRFCCRNMIHVLLRPNSTLLYSPIHLSTDTRHQRSDDSQLKHPSRTSPYSIHQVFQLFYHHYQNQPTHQYPPKLALEGKLRTCLTKGEIKRENHFRPLLNSFLSFSNLFIPISEWVEDNEMKDDNSFLPFSFFGLSPFS